MFVEGDEFVGYVIDATLDQPSDPVDEAATLRAILDKWQVANSGRARQARGKQSCEPRNDGSLCDEQSRQSEHLERLGSAAGRAQEPKQIAAYGFGRERKRNRLDFRV